MEAWCEIDLKHEKMHGFELYSFKSNPLFYAHNLYLNGELVTNLEIPNGVSRINNGIFYGCSNITSVTIPKSVTKIGYKAFEECNNLVSIEISDIEAWCAIDFVHKFPDYYSGDSGDENCNPLKNVHNLYLNGECIKDLSIPNSVTSISDYAFSGCSNLTSVTLPNSVSHIGQSAFEGCNQIPSVIIPESATNIGDKAFYNCKNLRKVVNCSNLNIQKGSDDNGCVGLYAYLIYNGLSVYDDGDFVCIVDNDKKYVVDYKGSSSSIELPLVDGIADYAFYKKNDISSVVIPNTITSIGNYAFYGCPELISVDIPSSLISIGNYSFSGCTGITSILIPKNVTNIGRNAFEKCSGLKTITILCSVSNFEYNAFWSCTNITSVHISDISDWCKITFFSAYSCPLYYAKELYINGVKVKNLEIKRGITSINDYAFYNCSCLNSVVIPNTVTSIGNYAFYNCSNLNSVVIPNTVTELGNYAFYSCM